MSREEKVLLQMQMPLQTVTNEEEKIKHSLLLLNVNYSKSKIYLLLLKNKNICHNELPPSQARTAHHRIIEMVKMNSRRIDGILVDIEV